MKSTIHNVLEIERLVPAHQRHTVSIDDHAKFVSAISNQTHRSLDEIDRFLDDELTVNPYAGDPPNRRSDKEIGKLLDLLDSLENSISERGQY